MLLVLVAVVGWRVWQVKEALGASEDAASALEAAIRDDDSAAADRAQTDLENHAAAADSGTSGPIWSTLRHLPLVGDDADAVRLASSALVDLVRSAVPALRTVADQRDDLLPQDGQVPLDRIAALRDPVATADRAVGRSADRLDQVDADALLGPLRSRWRSLVERVDQARADLAAARAAVDLLPTMLGGDGPRHLLLIFENNAEIRATGGLPGSAAEVTADDGRLSLGRQVAGSDLVGTTPVLPLTEAERRIYGPRLATDFRQANWTPDFPRSADLWEAHWNRRFPADPVDGVVAIDPVALSYLLRATGPITVGTVTLTSDNAVDELLSNVYARIPDPPDQDVFFRQVAAAVFARFTSGVQDTSALLGAFRQGVTEGRIRVQSSVPAEQGALARFSIAGVLPATPTRDPQLGLYLVDATGSKMSYYLRTAAQVEAVSCVDRVQRLDVTATLSSTLRPEDAAALPDYVAGDYEDIALDRGDQIVTVRLYGPVDGRVVTQSIDGATPKKAPIVESDGRGVATVYLVVPPGKSVSVTWRVQTPAGQTGSPQLQLTPGVTANEVSVDPSAC